MPQVHQLVGFHMQAVKGTEMEEQDGNPAGVVDVWMLIFTDRTTGEQIRISFRQDSRDELVRQLTGGIVLAGGDLPRV